MKEAYSQFLAMNGEMLRTCSRWQVKQVDGHQYLNDHTDLDYDREVLNLLCELNTKVQPICADLAAAVGRFIRYKSRFNRALEKLLVGNYEWFDTPRIESYHTVWFELHEDLLATLGIDRSSEFAQ